MASNKLYPLKDGAKDPIIDILRRLVKARADMEGKSPHKIMKAIYHETGGEISYAMLNNWFYGSTISPRYCSVARVYIAMRAYSKRSITIGDVETNVIDLTERRKRA